MRTCTSDGTHSVRCLDSMLIVYGLLRAHPARGVCERLVREREGWFALPATILEAYHVLVRVYDTPVKDAVAALDALVSGPVPVVPATGDDVLSGLASASALHIDPTDALLLLTCERLGVSIIATDDARLVTAAEARGFTIENPITPALRPLIDEWEAQNLPDKGLPRILRSVDLWLAKQSPELSPAFRSATGAYSHLP